MNQIGAIRRIDELGRIVIPKGIRSRLRINEGDRLEIGINPNGIIEIQKYNAFMNNYDSVTNIVLTLAKEIHHPVIVVRDGTILTKSDDANSELQEGIEIDQGLFNRLFERKNYTANNEMIVSQGSKYQFTMFPLAYNSEILGGLIVLHEGNLSEENVRIIHAFRNLLTTILKV